MDFNNDFIAACFVSYGFALLLNQNKSYLQGATRAAFGLRNKLAITNSPLFGESCICFLLLWDFILLWGVECWLLLICCGAALGATERTKPFNCKSKGRKKKKVDYFRLTCSMVRWPQSLQKKKWGDFPTMGESSYKVSQHPIFSWSFYWADIHYNTFTIINGTD